MKNYLKKDSTTHVDNTVHVASFPAPITDEVNSKSMSIAAPKGEKKKGGMPLSFERHHYEFWLKYFGKKEPERFIRHLQNGERYKALVTSIFKEYGLPEDLFYVGLIESGYNSKIKSRAKAVGPWQFIRGTGTRYGLRVDNSIDERTNIFKSTHAAAQFLKYLYGMFGNWELALCAYNAGEGRVARAMKKSGARDYKGLVRARALPLETIFYIPKVAAARELERNLEKYGLPIVEDHSDLFDRATPYKVTKKFSLSAVARDKKVSLEALRVLNPDVKKDLVTVLRKGHTLYLPENGSILPKRRPAMASNNRPVQKKRMHTVYVVRKGDSIHKISKRFNVKVRQLLSLNKLRRERVAVGQRIIIPI